jgi:hypothetical protein
MNKVKKWNEYLNENNLLDKFGILKNIADIVSDKLYCDKFGSCVHFAEEFVLEVHKNNPELLTEFFVIEGYVNWEYGDDVPQQHTWIELLNGEKIDPTFKQFTKYGWANISKKRSERFSGLNYYDDTIKGTWFSERRKQYPKEIFK